jgi:ribosome maturation factor RimP
VAGPPPGSPDAVRDVIAPVLARLQLQLDDVAVSTAGSRRLLRVVVDLSDDAVEEALDRDGGAPVPGLSLDAVADASRAVSQALDESDVMGDRAYVLEVTTPGVERGLTTPAHFRRNLRRRVTVTLGDGTQPTGRLEAADDALTLRVEGPKKGMTSTRTYPWGDVVRGVVQVDFTRVEDAPLVDLGDDQGDDQGDDEDDDGYDGEESGGRAPGGDGERKG